MQILQNWIFSSLRVFNNLKILYTHEFQIQVYSNFIKYILKWIKPNSSCKLQMKLLKIPEILLQGKEKKISIQPTNFKNNFFYWKFW